MSGSIDTNRFLMDFKYHLLSTGLTTLIMHILGYIVVQGFESGTNGLNISANPLDYVLGISAITTMTLAFVASAKRRDVPSIYSESFQIRLLLHIPIPYRISARHNHIIFVRPC